MNWLMTMSLRISDTFANMLPLTKAQDEDSFLPIETSLHIHKHVGYDPGHEVIDLVSIDRHPSNTVATHSLLPFLQSFQLQSGRYICFLQVPLPTSKVLAGCTTLLFFLRARQLQTQFLHRCIQRIMMVVIDFLHLSHSFFLPQLVHTGQDVRLDPVFRHRDHLIKRARSLVTEFRRPPSFHVGHVGLHLLLLRGHLPIQRIVKFTNGLLHLTDQYIFLPLILFSRTPLLLCTPCPNFCLSQQPCWDLPARCECPGGHWSSWADSLRMVRHRHPHGGGVEVDNPLACFRWVRHCKQTVLDAGFAIPHWHELADSPPPAKRFQSPANPRPDGNSGPPRSWNRSLCARRCGLLSATAQGF